VDYSPWLQAQTRELFKTVALLLGDDDGNLDTIAHKTKMHDESRGDGTGISKGTLSGVQTGKKPLTRNTLAKLVGVAPSLTDQLEALADEFAFEDDLVNRYLAVTRGAGPPSELDRFEQDDSGVVAGALRALSIARAADERRECLSAIDTGLQAIKDSSIKGWQVEIAKAYLLRELAYESETLATRTNAWERCMRALRSAARVSNDHIDVVAVSASMVVDAVQDTTHAMTRHDRQSAIREAKHLVEAATRRGELPDAAKSYLLTRKAALLRYESGYEKMSGRRLPVAQEAVRCAEAAVRAVDDPGTRIELGMAQWWLARWTKDEAARRLLLAGAEEALRSSVALDEGGLALAMFYRSVYRSRDACEAFPLRFANHRRGLRQAWIIGEAATNAHYDGGDDPQVQDWLVRAEHLLEDAQAAGITTARLVVANAFVKARLHGAVEGSAVLRDLCMDGGGFDWTRVMDFATTTNPTDEEADLFAVGLTDPALLTRIATFEWEVRGEPDVALAIYEAAVQSPDGQHNPVALTNLARFLIVERPGPESFERARRELQKAAHSADRLFTWWRDVQLQLEEAEATV